VSGLAQEKAKPAAPANKPRFTAEQIIDRSIEATGGRAAMGKLVSTYAKGTMEFTAQEVHGVMEFYAKAPNKQLAIMNLESVGEVRQGFDGQVAWGQDPTGQIIEISGAPLDDMKRRAVFNPALKWRELYSKAELQGEDTVGGRKAYIIRLTAADGTLITRYYDIETFLLLREKGSHETPQGVMDITADFSDYRDIGGVKAPFSIRQSLAAGEIVIKISEMKNNLEIDDAKFSKPAK
jgi:hypothetical protein